MLELLVGDDSFSKYRYCLKISEKEKKKFKTFDIKSWKSFEEFLPELYRKTLFSTEYCVYCDFSGTLSKKKIDYIKESAKLLEASEDNFLFLSVSKSIKGLKKNKKNFVLPKPWKEREWKLLVSQLAFDKHLKLSPLQTERLIYETNNDLWKINNELEKFSMIVSDEKIEEGVFNEMFYSYSKESLQKFTYEFVDRKSILALKNLEAIFKEYNQMQILYRLSSIYMLIYKIRMICISMNINMFNFNSVKEIASQVKSNIPTVSDIVGFSFDRNEQKRKICFQYSDEEIESVLKELLKLELEFKAGKVEFKSKIIDLYYKVHFEKKIV
jgi:DNA polymerase III delta subunit